MPGLGKSFNEYAASVPEYDDIPKAVWAAIAVSALTVGGDYLEHARTRVFEEWTILHNAGVVPQKPPKVELDPAGLQRRTS